MRPRVAILSNLKQSLSGSVLLSFEVSATAKVISHQLIPIICYLLALMLYITMTNDNIEAQLSQNKLESIANQTNVSVTPQINVGDDPFYVSYDNITGKAEDSVYVANLISDTISVINPANTNLKNILVGERPTFIARSPFDDFLYVANHQNDTVSVIDTLSDTVVKNITVGDGPISIYRSPSGQLYVANYLNATVSVISLGNMTVIKNMAVGISPTFIADGPGGQLYVANLDSNTVSVINPHNNTVIKNITVGENPIFIANSPFVNSLYVANLDSNTVSVINPRNNTVIKNITVGDGPSSIATSPFDYSLYVANHQNDTVSVIDTLSNTVIKNITVGNGPHSIASSTDSLYVANRLNDTISVINPRNNTVIKSITVGDGPVSIAVSPFGDSLYVANGDSDTVSVIDAATNKVVAGVTLDVIPFRGGQIICNGLDAPINRYFYVSSGTDCVAEPNSGYEFDSWVQISDDNSTRTMNASTTSGSLWTPFLDFLGVKSNDPAATLTVNRFGNFTAYFRALPPPVPAEFTFSLITVVITALVGSLLIPAAVGWFRSKKQTSRLNSFHQQMATIYADGKVDENDTNSLDKLNKNISDSYAAGKINNDQYTSLKNEVSAAYQKIFKRRIESITGPNIKDVNNVKNDIQDAYVYGKLTETHFKLLNEKISDMLSNK